jgi:hypothetical protein
VTARAACVPGAPSVRRAARAAAASGAAALLVAACASGDGSSALAYRHNRRDYEAFRSERPELLEPNYLPFMAAHVSPGSRLSRAARALAARLGLAAGPAPDLLVFCRWPDDAFPLPVWIDPPELSAELVEERSRRRPEDYVAAVERALRLWESGLDGLVRFRRVAREQDARLALRLTGARGTLEDPEIQVLGSTPVGGACEVAGGEVVEGHLDVRFAVRELRIHVADEFGLLLPDQVEAVALHEIGHALGMRSHSPIPADLMYPVARDRPPRSELGTEDVNSFLSLYQLRNGTIYRALPREPEPAPAPPVPSGPPALELAPHVDARLGYEIQLPRGWTHLDTGYGVVAVDGTTWDYEASIQVIVRAYDDIGEYLDRYGEWHLGRGRVVESREARIAGHPGRRYRLLVEDRFEEVVLVEPGDERVVVVLWDYPAKASSAFRPWLEASLGSLELRAAKGRERGRDYGSGAEGGAGAGVALEESTPEARPGAGREGEAR